jgi:2-dehydro-3-deoxyphosphogluconate aldolase / (4S)-4-hydroxy-2-oxoglutarate aldolase
MRSVDVFKVIQDSGIIAILRGVAEKHLLKTVDALAQANIRAIEITFNTPGAKEAIALVKKEFGDTIVVGAGTVVNSIFAAQAIESGAEFMLAPNMDSEVIAIVHKHGKLMIPGAFTATEVLKCYTMGCNVVKIFPAGSVGPKYIKEMRGPFDHVDLIPVGGVDISNVKDFIKAGALAVGVGGNLARKDLIEAENFSGLTALGKEFLNELQKGRC